MVKQGFNKNKKIPPPHKGFCKLCQVSCNDTKRFTTTIIRWLTAHVRKTTKILFVAFLTIKHLSLTVSITLHQRSRPSEGCSQTKPINFFLCFSCLRSKKKEEKEKERFMMDSEKLVGLGALRNEKLSDNSYHI